MAVDKKLEKKKASTSNELVRGTGLLLLFSPLILLALFGVVTGVVVSVLYVKEFPIMLVVFAALLLAMLFPLYGFTSRFQLLRGWIRGLREEYFRLEDVRSSGKALSDNTEARTLEQDFPAITSGVAQQGKD